MEIYPACITINNQPKGTARIKSAKVFLLSIVLQVDRNKLLQTEFPIIEFDPKTFQVFPNKGCI